MKKNLEIINLGHGWVVERDKILSGDKLLEQLRVVLLEGSFPKDWRRIKSSIMTNLWSFEFNGKFYVLKIFLLRGFFETIKARIKKTRAQRSWLSGCELIKEGFLTPPMQAWGVRRKMGLPEKNFLLTEFINDATGIFTLLSTKLKRVSDATKDEFILKQRRVLMKTLGLTIGRLHFLGIAHGDLRPDNILVKGLESLKPEIYFIDNESNRRFKEIPRKLILRNLVQLNMIFLSDLSQVERMRFFVSYLSAFSKLGVMKKELAREVWAITDKRLEKYGGLGGSV